MSMTLVGLLLRVVLLLLIAWVAVRALGRRSASLRALVWTLALGSALALPALTRALPSFELPLLDPPAAASTRPPAVALADAEPRMTAVAPSNLADTPPVQGIAAEVKNAGPCGR
jgi:hypothetical protein